MRSADSGPSHRCGFHNPHTRSARASRRSVSWRRRWLARDRRAPSPARGTGRSATGLRPWAACSVRIGRQLGVRHSAGGRGHVWPRGTARRRCDPPPAGGGRRMYTALPPAAPSAAACRRRGRLCGSVPDRGRHIACPRRGPSPGGRGRRRGASRRNRRIPSGRAREERGRIGYTSPVRRGRHGVGGGSDRAPPSWRRSGEA